MRSFKQVFYEQILGLFEGITIQHVGTIKAKVDTGNSAHNVLHAVNIKIDGKEVSFDTVNKKHLKLPICESIVIHIGSGNKEDRPVVKLDCSIGTKQFNSVPFSLADRSENDTPVLLGEEFIKMNGGVVNLNINNETQ